MNLKSTRRMTFLALTLLAAAVPSPRAWTQSPAAPAGSPAQAPGLLTREQTAPLVPPAVFFAGRVASTQARNAAAIRFPGNHLLVATLVDTSGYASDVKERYQAYFITETSLRIEGHTLPAGAYGVGFIANDTFVVMDIGGADLFTTHSTRDPELKRPTPLQILADAGSGGFRLYEGRSYIKLQPDTASH